MFIVKAIFNTDWIKIVRYILSGRKQLFQFEFIYTGRNSIKIFKEI